MGEVRKHSVGTCRTIKVLCILGIVPCWEYLIKYGHCSVMFYVCFALSWLHHTSQFLLDSFNVFFIFQRLTTFMNTGLLFSIRIELFYSVCFVSYGLYTTMKSIILKLDNWNTLIFKHAIITLVKLPMNTKCLLSGMRYHQMSTAKNNFH